MSHFERHVFFCCNQRANGEACCSDHGATRHARLRQGSRQGAQALRQGQGARQQAGCLDRCEEGPVIVVYPEAVWYTYVDRDDIDEIIDEHLVNGRVVERLKI